MSGNPGWLSPTYPSTLGLAWPAASSGQKVIGTDAASIAWSLTAQFTQTIGTLQTYVSDCSVAGKYLMEVFAAANIACGSVTTTTYRPSADLQNQGSDWQDNGGGTSNIYTKIDEATLDLTDYITYVGSGADRHRYAYNVASGGWGASRRVKAIRVIWVSETQTNTMALRPYLRVGATNYNMGAQVTIGTDQVTLEASLGEINPATSLPWTQADIVAMASTTGFGFTPFNGSSTSYRMYQSYVEIDWVTENRLAWGELAITPADSGWLTWTLTANWSKTATSEYVVLLRRINSSPVSIGSGSISVPYLDSGADPPLPMRCEHPFVEGAGCLSELGDDLTRLYPLIINTTAPAVSLDSQPYHGGRGISLGLNTNVEQEFTSPGAGTYTFLRCLLSVDADETISQTISVRRRSDDVVITTITLTPADVRAMPVVAPDAAGPTVTPVDMRLVEVAVPSATLAGVQYYFDFSTSLGDSWALWGMGTGNTSSGSFPSNPDPLEAGDIATFGGIVDTLATGGPPPAVTYDGADAPVTLSTQPAAPTGFNLSLEFHDLPTTPVGCVSGTVDFTVCAWSSTSLSAAFDSYEVERQVPLGQEPEWQLVAKITDETITEFRDYEAPVGIAANYRLRVIRAGDLVPSPWTAQLTQTRMGLGGSVECGWIFTSNLRRELTIAYIDGPDREYDNLDAPNVTYRQLYGRDYSVRFSETEYRGDRFGLTLIVYTGENPLPALSDGRWAFDPAIAYGTEVGLPYQCVLDWRGRRWYAGVEVPKMNQQETLNRYTVDVDVTEVSSTPTVIDETSTTFFLDTFDRAPSGGGVLLQDSPISNTGQAWGPFPAGFQFGDAIPAAIYDTGIGGLLGIASAVGGATYSIMDLSVIPVDVSATVVFSSDTRGTSAGGLLVGHAAMWNQNHIDNCLHMVLDPEGFIMQIFDGGSLYTIGTAIFDVPIPLDDVTESTFTVSGFGGDTINVLLPRVSSGSLNASFTDSRFSDLAGQFMILESFWPEGPGFTVPSFKQASATTALPSIYGA